MMKIARNRLLFVAAAGLSVSFVACGDDDDTTPADSGTDTAYDAADVGTDAENDAADIGADTTDAGSDTAPDAPDTGADTGADTAPDTTPDVADTGADTTPDAVEDTTDTSADTTDTDPDALEIIGEYDSNFGGFVRISETGVTFSWYGEDDVAITQFDNAGDWMVGQNASDDPWNPDLWSRFDWVAVDGGILWCQTAFGAESEEAAIATTPADAGDEETGCGGFAWTRLSPGQGPIAVGGDYDTNFGGFVRITGLGVENNWYGPIDLPFSTYSNAEEWAAGQNPSDDPWNPDLWSLVEWAPRDEGGFYWCQSVFDAETEDAAIAADGADREDWETGCGGFGWTVITAGQGPIVLEGDWVDDDGGVHSVADGAWTATYTVGETDYVYEYTIERYDNAAEFGVAENGDGNPQDAGLWTRVDWTRVDGAFWVCLTETEAASADAAAAVDRADTTDPATSGCGEGSWTRLDPAVSE